jgi:hypothetical protein
MSVEGCQITTPHLATFKSPSEAPTCNDMAKSKGANPHPDPWHPSNPTFEWS